MSRSWGGFEGLLIGLLSCLESESYFSGVPGESYSTELRPLAKITSLAVS